MAKVHDLDALREELEPRRIKLGGEQWELPGEFPLYVLTKLDKLDFYGLAEMLVGKERAEDFARLLNESTLEVIITTVYGLDPEAEASLASSRSTGKPRRPTSKRTTG